MLRDLYVADLRYPDTSVCDAKFAVAGEEIADRLVATFAFEAGVACTAGKEVTVGPIKVADRLLQALGIGLLEPFIAGFALMLGEVQAAVRL